MIINSKFINKYCLTRKGGLNNRVCLKSWWENRNLISIYNTLLEQTNFLPKKSGIAERLYCVYHNIPKRKKCQQCNKNYVSFRQYSKGYHEYCSLYCSTQSPERNAKISANIDYTKVTEKIKKTNLEKYGVEYYFQTKEHKIKTKKTKKRKYNNEYYVNIEKARKTNLEKYGVEYSCLAEIVKLKTLKTIKKRTPELFDIEYLQSQNKTKGIQQIADELNVSYRTVWLAFDRLNIKPNFFMPAYNKQQNEIFNFIQNELGLNSYQNDRNIIKPKEIDIYIPIKNVGIELNGTYWHSYDSTPTHEEKYRHYNKRKICNDKNIKLIQFWDDEWAYQTFICKDIIRRAMGLSQNKIYARNTVVDHVKNKEYDLFLEKYHMQGTRAASIKLGLYDKKTRELLSIMSLGKSRYNKKYEYELIRFCTKDNNHIIGGAKKLFVAFLKQYNPTTIISYCDRRLFAGETYSSLGFHLKKTTQLDYYWVKHNKRLNRLKTQKHKLQNLLNEYDENKSENENMFRNGYRKLFGCGNDVWIYKKGEK